MFRYFSLYKQLIVGKTFICMQPCLWLAVTSISNIAYIEKMRSLGIQYGGDLVIVWYGSFSSASCRSLQPSGYAKLYCSVAESYVCKHEIASIWRNNSLGMQTAAQNFRDCLLSVYWSHIFSSCQHCLVGIHGGVDMFSAFFNVHLKVLDVKCSSVCCIGIETNSSCWEERKWGLLFKTDMHQYFCVKSYISFCKYIFQFYYFANFNFTSAIHSLNINSIIVLLIFRVTGRSICD